MHIGVNCRDEKEATETAALFALIFDLKTREIEKSVFADPYFECMKAPGRGTMGHIALAAADLEEAVRELTDKGFSFDPQTRAYNENGKLRNIYLADEIAGFAVHIMQAR